MNLCSDKHDEVCFECMDCPMSLERAEIELAELQAIVADARLLDKNT